MTISEFNIIEGLIGCVVLLSMVLSYFVKELVSALKAAKIEIQDLKIIVASGFVELRKETLERRVDCGNTFATKDELKFYLSSSGGQ